MTVEPISDERMAKLKASLWPSDEAIFVLNCGEARALIARLEKAEEELERLEEYRDLNMNACAVLRQRAEKAEAELEAERRLSDQLRGLP